MAADKIQFRPALVTAALSARGGTENATASQVAQRDLGRYYELLALALASVDLSAGEAGLIVDALNGTLIDSTAMQMLAAEIEDSLDDGLAAKWEIDGLALVSKLRSYTLLQRAAICDAVERFWSAAYTVDSTADTLAAVGLIKRG